MRQAKNFGILALVALALVVLPGGGATLNVLLAMLTLAFFAAIAVLGFRLYREHRLTLDALSARQRTVLYGAIALAFLTFTATRRLFGAGGAGFLAWFALLGLCAYGVFWVYTQARRYE